MCFYTVCKTQPTEFRVSKFNSDGDPEIEHFVQEVGPGQFNCDCLGYRHRSKCRHLDILPVFIREGKVGRGELYDFKTKTFNTVLGAE